MTRLFLVWPDLRRGRYRWKRVLFSGREIFIYFSTIDYSWGIDVAFLNGQTMKGTFYDNSGSAEDEFTIQKSDTIPLNATNVTSFSISSANIPAANATEGEFDALNANGSKVNLNISGIVSPPPFLSEDNQSSLSDDNTVVSNGSESNTTKGMANRTYGNGVGASQDSPDTNSSLQVASDVITDSMRNKATKMASEMAKRAFDEAERALNNNKIATTNINLSEATDLTKYSEQSGNHGKQTSSNTIDTYNEPGMGIKQQLSQEAETQIYRAWKGLDDKFGDIVTKIEAADNLKSDSGPDISDASQSSNISSSHANSNSNSKTDNEVTENPMHTSTSQASKSDVHSASSENSHSVMKLDPKADAGQNQEVIEGTSAALDGTNSKIGEDSSGLRYSWKQVGGPKVKIVDANTATASFEAPPKISSARDNLILKFVLLITDSTGRNNNKDSVSVVVKQEPSPSQKVELSSSTNDKKDRSSSQAEDKVHSNDGQVGSNSGSKHNDNGKSEETKHEESALELDSTAPIETTHVNTNNSDGTSS